MILSRRHLILSLGAASASAALPRRAFAAYPERPIRLIVPFAAGGNADLVGRILGDVISRGVGQPVVVENRPGAGGGVGAELVANSKPDGYMLLVGSNGPLTINPLMNAKLGYDPQKDLAPVALGAYVPHALLISNKLGVKTMSELVAASKKKGINIATSGIGSATHMTLERLKAATGADITHVPYRGGGALLPDVMAGNVDGAMTEFSTAFQVHKSGDAHLVGIAATKRSDLAADVPTFIESGVKDFTAQSYVGVLAPAQTPADIIDKLQKAVADGLKAAESIGRLRGLGNEIATPEQMTSRGFAAFIRVDAENMKAAAQLAGIKPE